MSDNGMWNQAFPSHGSMGEVVQPGMSLRDYFAAKAMHGWMTTFCPVMFEDSDYEITARVLSAWPTPC